MQAIAPKFGLEFNYARAGFVTSVAEFSFALFSPDTFDQHLVAARLPGVVIGAATAVPLFFVGRRLSDRAGLIAAGVWSVHPFSIVMSRYIREYVYFSFVSTALLAIGLSLVNRFRGDPLRQLLVLVGAGLLMLGYASWDSLSTFRANAILTVGTLALAMLLLVYLDSAYRIRPVDMVIGGAVLGTFGVIIGRIIGRDGSLGVSLGRPGLRMWQYYAGGMDLVIARPAFVALIAGLLLLVFRSSDSGGKVLVLSLGTASTGMFLGIVNLWDRDPGIHYTHYLLPTMVLLLAIALDGGYGLLREAVHSLPLVGSQGALLGLGVSIMLFPLMLGVPNTGEILRTLREPVPRFVSHMDSRTLMSYVRTLPAAPQTMISTTSFQVTALLSGVEVREYHEYRFNDAERHKMLMEAFGTHDSGLLALDRERGRWSLSVPESDFSVTPAESDLVCVRYDGRYGDFHLWTWGYGSERDCEGSLRLEVWLATSDRSGLLFTG